MSACCGGTRYVETVYETDGVRRVRRLGDVVVCCKHQRPIGDVRRANTGRCLSNEEWERMLSHRPGPPWYFVKNDAGELLPENWQATEEAAS